MATALKSGKNNCWGHAERSMSHQTLDSLLQGRDAPAVEIFSKAATLNAERNDSAEAC